MKPQMNEATTSTDKKIEPDRQQPREVSASTKKMKEMRGLNIRRYYTVPGIHPFEKVEWERRIASITDSSGHIVFKQADVEVPSFWSQTATNIVVHKYFHGTPGTPERNECETIDRASRPNDYKLGDTRWLFFYRR